MAITSCKGHSHEKYLIHHLDNLRDGDHLCGLFRSDEEQIDLVTKFIGDGIKENAQILYVENREHFINGAFSSLKSSGLDVTQALDKGQLILKDPLRSYLEGGYFDVDKMLSFWKYAEDSAIAAGYSRLRVLAEPYWVNRESSQSQEFISYECKINSFFPHVRCVALCQYGLSRWTSSYLLDILQTHPWGLIGGELFQNFYYIPPLEFFAEDLPTVVLQRWMSNLQERKRTESALVLANKQALAAAEAKTQFMATVSHEIRTPLTGLLGMADVLTETPLSYEQVDCVESIKLCGTHLQKVINDVLEAARIESGKIPLESRPFELVACLKEAISLCTSGFQNMPNHVGVTLELDPNCPKYIIGDITRLRQILINLLGNAVKFSGKDSANVILKAKKIVQDEEAQDTVTLEFSVQDFGIGIPKEKIPTLFASFSQVDASTSRLYGGTGLGLSITKGLVELMGGKMYVQSELGKGSTFSFVLHPPVPPTRADSGSNVANQRRIMDSLPSIKILVAEDNLINQKVIAKMLTNMKMKYVICGDGQEAMETFNKTQDFGLVLLDLHMPVKDGWSTAREIRMKMSKEECPILVMTAALLPDAECETLNTLTNGVIVKPFTASQLLESMLEVLFNSRK